MKIWRKEELLKAWVREPCIKLWISSNQLYNFNYEQKALLGRKYTQELIIIEVEWGVIEGGTSINS